MYKYTVQVRAISERQVEVESEVPLTKEQIESRAINNFKIAWCSGYERLEVGKIELYSSEYINMTTENRPRCKVCGTTDHHVNAQGEIVINPPRRQSDKENYDEQTQ